MSLDVAVVWTLYRTELRLVLRDRRTLFVSVLLPLLVMPLMLLASRATTERREESLARAEHGVAIAGERADEAQALLAAVERRLQASGAALRFVEREANDPIAALGREEIALFLEVGRAATATRSGGAGPGEAEPPALPADLPVVRIHFRADRDTSANAAGRLEQEIKAVRLERRAETLARAGFPVAVEQVAPVERVDVAAAGQVVGLSIGRGLTAFLLLFVLSGAAVVATDSLAGEKERGTLETLLTTAASREEIIAGKLALILTSALFITLVQVANLLVYVGFRLINVPAGLAAAVPPGTAVLLLVLLLPIAALASAVLLLISGVARSYKEAQLYFFPVFLLGILPALAPLLPGVPLRSAIVVVPIANLAVGVKEALIGVRDWPMLGLAWLITAGAAVLVSRWAVRALSTERLITPALGESTGAQAAGGRFERHVLPAFGLMWGVMFLAATRLEAIADLRVQLAFNLVLLFAGGSALLIRRYRLDPRAALALRAPRPVVWLAVLLGAPAGALTAVGVFRLANLVLPVPRELLEAFSRAILPVELPFWQLLLFVAVLPAICEEMAFRGVLLYGLRRRMHPALLPLAVGVIFGLFHVALFRLAPTAFLGVLLTGVVLLSGSLYPAIAWHAINNGLGLLAARSGAALDDLPPGLYLAAAAVLAACFWLLWRTRAAYPDLRR